MYGGGALYNSDSYFHGGMEDICPTLRAEKNDAAVCVEYDDGNDVLRRKNSEARAADCHRDDNNHDNKGYPACRNL